MMKQFDETTNPHISEQFFHDPPLCPNFKNKTPPLPILEGRKLCMCIQLSMIRNIIERFVKTNDEIICIFSPTSNISQENISSVHT